MASNARWSSGAASTRDLVVVVDVVEANGGSVMILAGDRGGPVSDRDQPDKDG